MESSTSSDGRFDDGEVGQIIDCHPKLVVSDGGRGVLSIDVGLQTMASCLVTLGEAEQPVVELWHLGSLGKISAEHVFEHFEALGVFADEYDGPRDVVVERQLRANPAALRLEALVEMLFWCHGWRVFFMQPARKLDGPLKMGLLTPESKAGAKTYAARKKLAVAAALEWLKRSAPASLEWSAFFGAHKKKDDLADAFAQALTFLQKS